MIETVAYTCTVKQQQQTLTDDASTDCQAAVHLQSAWLPPPLTSISVQLLFFSCSYFLLLICINNEF